MRRTAVMLTGLVFLLTLSAAAQESRSDISLQGTGFFTRDTSGQGISRTTSDAGGFMVGYRYHINRRTDDRAFPTAAFSRSRNTGIEMSMSVGRSRTQHGDAALT
jgi:hypothetical protein